MLFADRLAELMQKNGITNYRLSKTIGCSATTVKNWLEGKEVTPVYLQKLSDVFNVSTDYLLTGEQKEKPLINDDEELTEFLEQLRNRPECRMLFSLTKDATKSDVEKAVAIIEALRKTGDK